MPPETPPQARPLPITFLSDYGYDDDFAGVCRGVIQRIAPGATVIDITHGLPRHEIRPAALVLRNTLPYMPEGVHLAVVDPEVGTERRAIALRTADGRLLVGPDNGLLWLAAERLGGIELAVDVSRSDYRLEPVSATFQGRDVFAPVAARLALGAPPEEAGEPFPPDRVGRLDLPLPVIEEGDVRAHALLVDRFGNVQLNVGHDDLVRAGFRLGRQVEVDVAGERFLATYAQTFADVKAGEILVYEDSYRTMAVAINRGNAAETLGVRADVEVRLIRLG